MRRRDLVKGVAAGALGPVLSATSPLFAAPLGRRVRPGERGWPDERVWGQLNEAVGGRLIRPAPIAAACEPNVKSPACQALFKELANPYYVGDQAGGTQVSGWLDAWTPSISPYAVEAASTRDVVAAVNFARAHDLRVAVKGGGHSYQGTSNAPDSLLIWTRRMNQITPHDAFAEHGSDRPPVPAVSIGAGAMWVDAYDVVTTKAGRYVQGGGCSTVGVAGLVLGGGFGSFSKCYGLAGASLLEAEIVTADGQVRVVNAHRDPDLFWALKGGGQCAFGVVTRLTLKTHELAELAGGCFGVLKAGTDEAFRRLIGRFVDLTADNLINPHWGESVRITRSNRLEVNMVFQGLTGPQAQAVWKPLTDWASSAGTDITRDGPDALAQPMRAWWDFAADRRARLSFVKPDPRPGAPDYHVWWSGDGDQVSMFIHGYDSLWLPAGLLAPTERERLADGLYAASRHYDVELHFNKGLAGAPPEAIAAAGRAATNPAVLDAFALAIVATGGLPNYPGYPKPNLAAAGRDRDRIDAAMAVLRPLAPAGGSYVSESNYFNPQWRRAFWGSNYPRLAGVKAKYDPAGMFIVHHGVGSERWSADGFTRIA